MHAAGKGPLSVVVGAQIGPKIGSAEEGATGGIKETVCEHE